MNLPEATALVGTIRALCPSQQLDTYAAEAWEMALFDITARDAAEALKRLVRRDLEPGKSRYIEPGHIRGEVGRIRDERIDKHPPVDPPPGLNTRQYLAWRRKIQERIADGEVIESPALEARPIPDYEAVVKDIA